MKFLLYVAVLCNLLRFLRVGMQMMNTLIIYAVRMDELEWMNLNR